MDSIVRKAALALVGFGMVSAVASSAAAACGSDDQCKGDRVCIEGSCQPPPAKACNVDVECPGEQVCVASVCGAPAGQTKGAASWRPAATTPDPSKDVGPTETQGILGLIIAGPIVTGVTWMTTIGATAALGGSGEFIGYASIPVFGPWVMLAADDDGEYGAAMVSSGLLQGAGLTMMILGLSIRHEVPAETASTEGSLAAELELAPMLSPEAAGLVVSGSF